MRSLASSLAIASLFVGLYGCNVEVQSGNCPDPADPEVHYISDDPSVCASADLAACAEGQVPFDDECGCGCIGPESPLPPGCPDPSDPEVHYVGQGPDACAAAFFACGPEQTLFDDECGCGCIGPESTCPNPSDPDVHYISQDPADCALIDFACSDGQTGFSDDCGCGCIGPETPQCPDPMDPSVHYASHDPDTCALVDLACEPGQEYFDGDCGCGCIDTACHGLDEAACSQSLVCMPSYQGVCDCECENGAPGCAECPPSCFVYVGCAFSGE